MTASPLAPPVSVLSYYVERNLDIAEFARWAITPTSAAHPTGGGNPTPRALPLRSVVGPPGCGKSTFLAALWVALSNPPNRVIVFWLDASTEAQSEAALREWLSQQTSTLRAKKYSIPSRVDDLTVSVYVTLTTLLRALGEYPVVVIVDRLEDLAQAQRTQLEKILAPVLRESNARIVLARRDEDALDEALLRWNEEVHRLETLDARRQIEQRLAVAVAVANPAALLDPHKRWDAELDNLIVTCRLNAGAQAALVTALAQRGRLTVNPLTNLIWLKYTLLHWGDPDTDYRPDCLREYLDRAKVTPGCNRTLHALPPLLDAGQTFSYEAYEGAGLDQADLESLLAAGVVFLISGTMRYRLEPGVATFI